MLKLIKTMLQMWDRPSVLLLHRWQGTGSYCRYCGSAQRGEDPVHLEPYLGVYTLADVSVGSSLAAPHSILAGIGKLDPEAKAYFAKGWGNKVFVEPSARCISKIALQRQAQLCAEAGIRVIVVGLRD